MVDLPGQERVNVARDRAPCRATGGGHPIHDAVASTPAGEKQAATPKKAHSPMKATTPQKAAMPAAKKPAAKKPAAKKPVTKTSPNKKAAPKMK